MRETWRTVLYGLSVMLVVAGCTSKAGESRFSVIDHISEEQEWNYKLKRHALQAADFAREHHYNIRVCFLIDMSRPSGSNRFMVYNLEKDSVVGAGLVAHGRCNKTWLRGRQYSNVSGCGCTSLGKYKIGNPYTGRFGLAYKLYGLDTSNSNAYNRFVVLHSHECVPSEAVYPQEICQSDGCPTVSPAFLTGLAKVIDKSSLPVLMWIYE